MVIIEVTQQSERIIDWTIVNYGIISMTIIGLISSTFSEERCWGLPGLIVRTIKEWKK